MSNALEKILSSNTSSAFAVPLQSERKAVFLVDELAQRWQTHPETVRILIRRKALKPLRGLKPYRITFDEVKRYESLDDATEIREAFNSKWKGGRK